MNAAQRIHQAIGYAVGEPQHKQAHGNQTSSATKRGPGRYAKGGEAGSRISKARPQRAYRALMAAWAAKRVTKVERRDEHGSFTYTGRRDTFAHADREDGRRKWLAGISAQRGF